jgi:ubiquinone/menaquinone biosynthesis C-methylase UbiE
MKKETLPEIQIQAPVPSETYTREYFMSCCDGYRQFSETRGQELQERLLLPLSLAALQPGMRVVDVGCGRGEIVFHAARKECQVWGIDYAPEAVRVAKETLTEVCLSEELARWVVAQVNARQMPFSDDSVDVIFMLDVVEHLYPHELDEAMKEAFRILRPGGRLIVHTMPSLWYYHFGYPVYRGLQRLRGQHLPANPRDRWDYSHVHVNEQTPIRLKKTIRQSGFTAKVWLRSVQNYDYESNWVMRWGMKFLTTIYPFRWIFCNDIFAIGTKK